MIAADQSGHKSMKLLAVKANGGLRHLRRSALARMFSPGDVVIANDAATVPASLAGTHQASGAKIEIRLAGWLSSDDPSRFIAVAFGPGDHRTPTERRPPPPPLSPGDRLSLGRLAAVIDRLLDHPRLVALSFAGSRACILAGLAAHGRPIQYAHVPQALALWDMWTPIAARPVAFEPPSAGFAIDWRTLDAWRSRDIHFATVTHAAGISSTGDALLDLRLPFDEPYRIPQITASLITEAKTRGRRVIAIGTTVVRALESAGDTDGSISSGRGIAQGRIGERTDLRVVDAILTGVHQPGESHFELLRAFAGDAVLDRLAEELSTHGYRGHEFGDSVLLYRGRGRPFDVQRPAQKIEMIHNR
jgi:S-adenosylmethionine:tRNA ribosyltransferase-isomerase